jgi:hypothetical protein
MKGKALVTAGLALVVMVLIIAACSTPPEPTPCPTAEAVVCPDCPDCPAPPPCPEAAPCPEPVVKDVPFEELWVSSPHNDATAEAFVHWDGDDPAEVPAACAKCHSTTGILDFLGVDGSEVGSVESAVPVPGGTVACITCHNSGTAELTSVTFPSGLEVSNLGNEAVCMLCHQGRASKKTVDDTLGQFEATDLDAVPAPITGSDGSQRALGFINIHYYPAGATLYGTQVKGGYEYDGKVYDGKFRHVEGIETCVGCHNTHSLEVKVETCAECHTGELTSIRMQGSLADYDGDGDISESIASEIRGLQDNLYGAIQAYATQVVGTGIVYDAMAFPYFFADADGDGAPDSGESGAVRFTAWTPRLLKAAYNYQNSAKDPGAFAHNAKYMIQLMYDSIEDLNVALGTIDMTAMHRNDPGHFAGSTEAFRHWDVDGEVPGSCARCHSATGLPTFIKEGVNISAEISNGFMCTTCHNDEEWPALYVLNAVTFPSGASLTFGEANESNLCLACHQGRASGPTVARGLAGKPGDTVDETVRFTNIHYFSAGATLFGSEAKGMYEFEGREYDGPHGHVAAGFTCGSCHNVHALEVKTETCAGCHPGATSLEAVRFGNTDWDGDGDTTEGVAGEVETMGEMLYEAMKAYAADKSVGIVYDPVAYPYFFEDADGDGVADVGDSGLVRYSKFTPNLAIAAYNFQYYKKDPGAYAHNAKYVMQVLYDSIALMGGNVSGMTRP